MSEIKEGTLTAKKDGTLRFPTNGKLYRGAMRVRVYYDPERTNGTYRAMDLCHRDFMEACCTMFATDNGAMLAVGFRTALYVSTEYRNVVEYRLNDAVAIVAKNSDEYIGPGISSDDYFSVSVLMEDSEEEILWRSETQNARILNLRVGMCDLCGWKVFADGTCSNTDCKNCDL